MKLPITVFILSVFLTCAGCGDGVYIFQSIKGHFGLMSKARPIEQVLAEKEESDEVCEQLEKVLALRKFAVNTLHLPDQGSYQNYADLERPYAVWNVVAAPEFSLDLKEWCFPIIGCVTYRGYFSESEAQSYAESLAQKGYDVDVYGVEAYSTLSWFDDPVLNTFLKGDDLRLAALLFHEMAHQVVYVPDDTTFNESFAKTVEREGLRRWVEETQSLDLWQKYERIDQLSKDFQTFLGNTRSDLEELYNSDLYSEAKMESKKLVLEEAHESYQELKKSWGGYGGFDVWMSHGLNNARLSSVAVYHDFVPAFESLLNKLNYDLEAFYAEAAFLASLPKQSRLARIKSAQTFKSAFLESR